LLATHVEIELLFVALRAEDGLAEALRGKSDLSRPWGYRRNRLHLLHFSLHLGLLKLRLYLLLSLLVKEEAIDDVLANLILVIAARTLGGLPDHCRFRGCRRLLWSLLARVTLACCCGLGTCEELFELARDLGGLVGAAGLTFAGRREL